MMLQRPPVSGTDQAYCPRTKVHKNQPVFLLSDIAEHAIREDISGQQSVLQVWTQVCCLNYSKPNHQMSFFYANRLTLGAVYFFRKLGEFP
jgi:hypothetical protein